MRISDWSSDVCSSDLLAAPVASLVAEVAARLGKGDKPFLHQPIDRALRKAAIRLAGAGRSPGQQRNSFVDGLDRIRSEEHTSELQSLMRISYAVFCLKKKKHTPTISSPHTVTLMMTN